MKLETSAMTIPEGRMVKLNAYVRLGRLSPLLVLPVARASARRICCAFSGQLVAV
jgi:hypothetical protein